ncbi:MAG: glycosyltransferase family 2 protein [Xenococcaceae cyanobacterium MO_167.B27]|nr:glycosyltransferase family 2 protein [Xenococcaceae cyanobacterium MO_167.B27]
MNVAAKEPVYIIIPVHNRRQITLKCLDNLSKCGDLQRYYVVVVDDGSTDGTTEAINSSYPDVTVLPGDGNLWWTGAIKKGMQYAYEQGAEYFIWLNDDCYPLENAIVKLIEISKSGHNLIVGGQSLDPDTKEPSYGGIVAKGTKIQHINAHDKLTQECDGLAGNFVCISSKIINSIGYPKNKIFPQYYGDVTYTNTAKKKGYKLLISKEAIAYCKNQHSVVSWLNPDKPLIDYWLDYFKIKSTFYWKAELLYYKQFLGFMGLVMYFINRILKFWVIFLLINPLPLNLKLKIKHIF